MTEQRLSELEKKWLDGSISAVEAEEYANWYNSGQNEPLNIPESIARSREEHQLKMLENILGKLEKENESKTDESDQTPVRKIRTKYFYPIAASLILFLGIGGIWLYNYLRNRESTEIVKQDKAPGQSGLVITLEDGREVLIDSIPDGVIAVENGISIIKKDGAIYYEGTSDELAYNTATTKKGRKFELVLPDNSKVWLNAASQLKYPVVFTGKTREVELSGEAYFEVEHNSEKPFVVKAGNQRIKVLGTQFNVNNYSDENHIATTLIDGSVEVAAGNEEEIIEPNQQAISSNLAAGIQVTEVNAKECISWVRGEFNFNNADLKTILNQISRWYDIDIQILPGVDQNQIFYGSTNMNQNLSEVLKVLELSGINLTLEGNTLTVKP